MAGNAPLLRSALLGSLERGALSPDDLLASGDALPAASGCARGLPPPDSWDGRRALGEPPEESRAPGPRLASAWLLPPLGWGARGNACAREGPAQAGGTLLLLLPSGAFRKTLFLSRGQESSLPTVRHTKGTRGHLLNYQPVCI